MRSTWGELLNQREFDWFSKESHSASKNKYPWEPRIGGLKIGNSDNTQGSSKAEWKCFFSCWNFNFQRRRRRHTGDSMDGLTDSAKSSYGYRLGKYKHEKYESQWFNVFRIVLFLIAYFLSGLTSVQVASLSSQKMPTFEPCEKQALPIVMGESPMVTQKRNWKVAGFANSLNR